MSQSQGTVAVMRTPDSSAAPLLVFLGGGIGSGKSSIASLFEAERFVVISADEIGRCVLDTDDDAMRAVELEWPSVVRDGVLDRGLLASIVFTDPAQLATLEAITHPAIAHQIVEEVVAAESADVVVEIPLQHLPISSIDGWRTRRVAVVAPESLRLARAVARGNDADDVKRRMRRQSDDVAWEAWSDHVIDNAGAWTETKHHVQSLIEELRASG